MFEQFGIKPELVRALHEQGIKEPTTIQQKAIPLVLAGKDVIGMSKTGSGKTAAFGIPALNKMVPRQGLQVLILSPTRELAQQISQELAKFSKYTRCSIATVFGGVGMQPQVQQIARSEIVVGTPGRILDHLNHRTLDLSKISCFVLDEADKMVEMGFIEDVEEILQYTPEKRQILLFGATLSKEIDRIKDQHMRNPEIAEAESQVEEDLLEQFYYNCQPHEKFSLLVHFLNKEKIGQAIIFCSARSTVELVQHNLRQHGIKAEMIHGKLSQNRRLQVIEAFNQGKQAILVASPVAARGLDIKGVTHVFNYDLAKDPQEYIHRIGRTARAGESGKAITLLSQRDYEPFGEILRHYRVNVHEMAPENFARLRFDAGKRFDDRREGPQGSRFGGRSFGRPSDRSFGPRRENRENSYRGDRGGRYERAPQGRGGWGL